MSLHGILGQHFYLQDRVGQVLHDRNFIEIYLNGISANELVL